MTLSKAIYHLSANRISFTVFRNHIRINKPNITFWFESEIWKTDDAVQWGIKRMIAFIKKAA